MKRDRSAAQTAPPSKKTINLHKSLEKAESWLATQIRSGKIGLIDFLYRQQVPSVASPACLCGAPRQTARHVLLLCNDHPNRDLLRASGPLDYQFLTSTGRGLKAATTWLMGTGLLIALPVLVGAGDSARRRRPIEWHTSCSAVQLYSIVALRPSDFFAREKKVVFSPEGVFFFVN